MGWRSLDRARYLATFLSQAVRDYTSIASFARVQEQNVVNQQYKGRRPVKDIFRLTERELSLILARLFLPFLSYLPPRLTMMSASHSHAPRILKSSRSATFTLPYFLVSYLSPTYV